MRIKLKEKDLPKFKDIIGLYADDETDVSTSPEADLQRFTPKQITDHCEKIDNLCLSAHSNGKLMFESMQIIKQLQSKQAELLLHDIFGPSTIADLKGQIKQLQEENEQLKDVIILEADTMVAHAVFDDLGNDARFVKRLFLTVGDIIPELKPLADEVELTLRAGG